MSHSGFHQIIGNEKAVDTLARMIRSGRICHAMLICGDDGLGKRTFANRIAASFLCQAPTSSGEPCGRCSACRKVMERTHPDLTVIDGYTRPNSFPVDVVREIRKQAYIRPNEGNRRIFVLCNAHSMGPAAQNALLKIIEEPPAHAVFVLTCNNREQMLETIRSRVVSLTLAPVSPQQAQQFLQSQSADDEVRQLAYDLCDGNIGAMQQILQQQELQKIGAAAKELLEQVAEGQKYESLCQLSQQTSREEFTKLLHYLQILLEKALVRSPEHPQITALCTKFSRKKIMAMLDEINRVQSALGANANLSLLLTRFCAKLYE